MLTDMNGKYADVGEVLMAGSTTSRTARVRHCPKNLGQRGWLLLQSGRKIRIHVRLSLTAAE